MPKVRLQPGRVQETGREYSYRYRVFCIPGKLVADVLFRKAVIADVPVDDNDFFSHCINTLMYYTMLLQGQAETKDSVFYSSA
jgi:hypothetical protein